MGLVDRWLSPTQPPQEVAEVAEIAEIAARAHTTGLSTPCEFGLGVCVGPATSATSATSAVDQMELARRASRHPLPPGAPICNKCHLLLCGEGRQRLGKLYHRQCLT
jgi:hypothetical protein